MVAAYKNDLDEWIGEYSDNEYPGRHFGEGPNLYRNNKEDDDETLELVRVIRSNDDTEEMLEACIRRMCLSPEDEADSDNEDPVEDFEVLCRVAQLVSSNDYFARPSTGTICRNKAGSRLM